MMMCAPKIEAFLVAMIAVWLILLIAVQLEARNDKAPSPTNFWFQSQHGRRDSTNMHNVTLQSIVGLLNETNSVVLTLRDGMVHVRVLP